MNVKVFNLISKINKTSANVDQMQVFVIINKGGMKIDADVNAKN